jgi:hypothetical protein
LPEIEPLEGVAQAEGIAIDDVEDDRVDAVVGEGVTDGSRRRVMTVAEAAREDARARSHAAGRQGSGVVDTGRDT